MISESRISEIRRVLRLLNIDAWLFFDHHHRDPISYQILGLDESLHVSRRWYYLIPKEGEPQSLVHLIESGALDSLPGTKHLYSSWRTHNEGLAMLLFGLKQVAMQYSPGCAIPLISNVDGGTVELIRSFGVDVVSSADMIQIFHATLDAAQIESHYAAGKKMDAIRAAAFDKVRNGPIDEWQLHTWMREAFDREGLLTDHGPIVAVNEHAADPHYEPSLATSRPIQSGDLLLIDMWAKLKAPRSIYYDITWTAFLGSQAPSDIQNVFNIVTQARDAAFEAVKAARDNGGAIQGFQVDDAARQVITQAGFGEFFVHRTGHSIHENVHGTGANMDNLENHDERQILTDTLFSVEPGIYLYKFGIRSEFNVLALERSATVTGEIQRELLLLP